MANRSSITGTLTDAASCLTEEATEALGEAVVDGLRERVDALKTMADGAEGEFLEYIEENTSEFREMMRQIHDAPYNRFTIFHDSFDGFINDLEEDIECVLDPNCPEQHNGFIKLAADLADLFGWDLSEEDYDQMSGNNPCH